MTVEWLSIYLHSS